MEGVQTKSFLIEFQFMSLSIHCKSQLYVQLNTNMRKFLQNSFLQIYCQSTYTVDQRIY